MVIQTTTSWSVIMMADADTYEPDPNPFHMKCWKCRYFDEDGCPEWNLEPRLAPEHCPVLMPKVKKENEVEFLGIYCGDWMGAEA